MTGSLIIGEPGDESPPPPPGPFLEPLPIPEERTGSDITLHVREADVPVLPGAADADVHLRRHVPGTDDPPARR